MATTIKGSIVEDVKVFVPVCPEAQLACRLDTRYGSTGSVLEPFAGYRKR